MEFGAMEFGMRVKLLLDDQYICFLQSWFDPLRIVVCRAVDAGKPVRNKCQAIALETLSRPHPLDHAYETHAPMIPHSMRSESAGPTPRVVCPGSTIRGARPGPTTHSHILGENMSGLRFEGMREALTIITLNELRAELDGLCAAG